MQFSDLRNEQARQIIDVEQVYSAYRTARTEQDGRYAGSLSWKQINGGLYLYRKTHGSSRSLGPKSDVTERLYGSFHENRNRNTERLRTLTQRLDEMAPVNKALGIGRVPVTSARILRLIGSKGLMGKAFDVVGTHALFAYERLAGVQVASGLLATGDIDLLFDSRRNLKLASSSFDPEGLLGLLRKVDRSFVATGRGSFRAVNDHGFMVDLIKPTPKNRFSAIDPASIGGPDDLQAIEIEGLVWLINSPKQRVVVIDDRGYPLDISVPDPRSFAIHKAWLSHRDDRDPIKRKRDRDQAMLVAVLVAQRLPHLSFEGKDLLALPRVLCQAAAGLLEERLESGSTDAAEIEPKW